MRWQYTCAARFQPRLKNKTKEQTLIRGHSQQGSACGVTCWAITLRRPQRRRFCLAVSQDFQQSVSCRKVFWGNNGAIKILRLSGDGYEERQSKAFFFLTSQKFYLSLAAVHLRKGMEWALLFNWQKGGYPAPIHSLDPELMCCGRARALWEDQESISRIGGQARPRGPEPRTVCGRPPRCVSQVRSRGGPK